MKINSTKQRTNNLNSEVEAIPAQVFFHLKTRPSAHEAGLGESSIKSDVSIGESPKGINTMVGIHQSHPKSTWNALENRLLFLSKLKLTKPYKGIGALLLLVFLVCSCASKKGIVLEETKEPIQKKEPSLIQIKYAAVLGIVPDSITNTALYNFIDSWEGTPYKMGGETAKGIDCSSFTQLLYGKVYNLYIERTAHKQFTSKELIRFRGKEYLKEGDLLFFQHTNSLNIDHVGIYLDNNKFVHSTANKAKNKKNGVQISDITTAYWEKLFVAAGKRKDMVQQPKTVDPKKEAPNTVEQ